MVTKDVLEKLLVAAVLKALGMIGNWMLYLLIEL